MDDEFEQIPESVPSTMETLEPTTPRFFGSLGLGALAVGTLALVLNNYGPRLIGPTVAIWFMIIGSLFMLYHAARDSDQMVRRLYLMLGFATLGAGVALSLVPRTGIAGEWFFPWGLLALLGGLFFSLAAGRHEHEAPWTGLATWLVGLIGVVATVTGMFGVAWSIGYLPRFAGVALLGLTFWWASIARQGTSDTGYRFGQLLGAVGIVALIYAIGRSLAPAMTQSVGRYFMPQGVVLITLASLALMVAFGVCSDRPIIVMARRELSAYFYSPVAYIVLFGVAIVAWLGYSTFLDYLMLDSQSGRDAVQEPIVRNYAAGLFSAVTVMFVVPAITMRLLSEERRTGTIEVLLTGPVSEWQVVLSKFLAGLIFFLVLSIPWALFLIPMYLLGRTGFDYLPLLSFYIALVCSGAAFIAMGLFFSSLTRNQVIAAVLTFAGMFLFLSFLFMQRNLGVLRPVADQLSFYTMWLNALSGQLQVHRLITFLSIAVFWLYLTTRVLEARKWS